MLFGPKQTMEIWGHCSEAQSRSRQKLMEDVGSVRRYVEVSGRQWKARKMAEGVRRCRKRLEGHERGQKRQEGTGR